ncbi:MAG: TlpA disulfide reductase family protein [Rhodocyclaceae bacterium]|nr:TlpA disulfide reductase family protein [Rhodocyclaceae bacterium]
MTIPFPNSAAKSAAMLALVALCALAEPAAAVDLPASGPLFAATLSGLDDQPQAFAAYKGRPLVVNFWARWCAPCRKEIPEFIKARARHKGGGVEVLGIAIEEQAVAVRDFAKAYDIDYPLLLAKDNGITLMQALGNAQGGLPFTLAIDRRGEVVYLKLGTMTAADIDAAFAAASKR